VVVSFLALLELLRESLVELVQNEPFAPIYLRAASAAAALETGDAFPDSESADGDSDRD